MPASPVLVPAVLVCVLVLVGTRALGPSVLVLVPACLPCSRSLPGTRTRPRPRLRPRTLTLTGPHFRPKQGPSTPVTGDDRD